MKLKTVNADTEDMFRVLDDALFWGEIKKEDLEWYQDLNGIQTEFDSFVADAIRRVLNISLGDGGEWYNGSKGKEI